MHIVSIQALAAVVDWWGHNCRIKCTNNAWHAWMSGGVWFWFILAELRYVYSIQCKAARCALQKPSSMNRAGLHSLHSFVYKTQSTFEYIIHRKLRICRNHFPYSKLFLGAFLARTSCCNNPKPIKCLSYV